MLDDVLACAILAFALLVLTVVGHLIWCFFAWLIRLATGPSQPAHAFGRLCPFCETWTTPSGGRCQCCGRDLASKPAEELADLHAMRRQIQRLAKAGRLTAAQLVEFHTVLETRELELRRPAGAVPAASSAVPPAAEPSHRAEVVPALPPSPAIPPTIGTKPDVRLDIVETPPVAPAKESLLAPAKESLLAPAATPAWVPERSTGVAAGANQSSGAVWAQPPMEAKRAALERLAERPAASSPVPPEAVPARPPRKPFSKVLVGFMQERNIRWGEVIALLAGAILFVGPSIALVISLWETLTQTPLLTYSIFVAYFSGVFGIGLFWYHRWKLEHVGRTMLIIATLLVPLYFWIMASLSKQQWSLGSAAAELASLAIFAWLVGLAGRVLVPGGRWYQVAGVVLNAGVVPLAVRLPAVAAHGPAMVVAGMIPVLVFLAAVGGYLWSLGNRRTAVLKAAPGLFTLLGTAGFSLIVALGLLVDRAVKLDGLASLLGHLAVPAVLASLPLLAAGLSVVEGSGGRRSLAGFRVAGTAVGLLGAACLLAGVVMAWPDPAMLVAVGSLATAALVYIAFRYRLPLVQAGAIASATLVYLVGYHLLAGHLAGVDRAEMGRRMLELVLQAQTGLAMVGLAAILAVVSELLARLGRRRHSLVYLGGCGVVAAAGLLLVSVDGTRTGGADALRAAILYTVYGAGSLVLTARWRRLGLSYLGLLLVASAALWVLWSQSAAHHVGPGWGAVLAIEAFVMAAAAAVLQRYAAGAWYDPWNMIDEDRFAASMPRSEGLSLVDLYRIPLIHLGEAAAMLAAGLTVWTAWSDWELIAASPTPAPIVASASIAAVYFLLAWLYRSSARTWAASLIALAGMVHALNFNYFQCAGHLGPQGTIALLGHATLAVLAGLCLDRVRSGGKVVRRTIGQPLADSALFSSVLALPAIVFGRSAGSLWLACCFPWLAAVWLVLAWRNRSVVLFAGHQAALAFAAVAATTAWLKHVGWITPYQLPTKTPNLLERMASVSHAVLEPRNLQAWGVALGLLSLVWVVARIVSLRRGIDEKRLLQSRWSVDGCIRHGVVAMLWLLVACCTLAEVPCELVRGLAPAAPAAAIPGAFGPTAWILLGVLAVMLAATLWERWSTAELVAVLLLAATVPCLIAGRFATDLAVASASRWTLAVGFAVSSIAVWGRKYLADGCRRIHAGPFARGAGTPPVSGPRVARSVLLATMVLPVLAITVVAAMLRISGAPLGGPAAKTFFETLGPTWSYLVPLVLLIGALVGYGVRESSAGYAFCAGLVLEMAVTLGYLLHAGTGGIPQTVMLLQLATITASAWAIVWLVARRWLDVWREPQRTPHAPREGVRHAGGEGVRHAERDEYGSAGRRLMSVQIAMGILGNGLLMAPALLSIIFLPAGWQDWSLAEGLWPGWVALALLVVAAAVRQVQTRGRFTPQAAGLVGMTALALLACTVLSLVPWAPEWGYRTLMLGWAMYAVVVVAATWWVASLRTLPGAEGPPQFLIRAAATWVVAARLAATLLGLKAAFFHDDPQDRLWGAAAIALASTAGAAMAVWRRREGWALAASPGVNLAASLVVWFVQRSQPFDLWWLPLLEANVIAAAAVALVWLAARKRLYELGDLTVRTSPLLALQTALAPLGTVALLSVPVVCLLQEPDRLPRWVTDLAAAPGWMAVLLAAVAAAWYLRQAAPRDLVHVPGSLALALGVLAACAAGRATMAGPERPWLSYHVLTAAWAAAGLAVLGIGWAGRKLRVAGQVDPAQEKGDSPHLPERPEGCFAQMGTVPFFRPTAQPILAGRLIASWVILIGVLTVALALCYAAADPAAPWWSLGALLTVSLTFGLLAVWRRQSALVWASGLLFNVAATVVWVAWWRFDPVRLVEINVVALAAAALAWSLVRPFIPDGIPAKEKGDSPHLPERPEGCFAQMGTVPFFRVDGRRVPFVPWAARAGLALLGLLVWALLVCDLMEIAHPAIGRLGPICLAASLLSIAVCFWDRTSRFVLAGLYGWALTAAGMGLAALALKPELLCWTAGLALALFVLAMAIAGGLWARYRTRHAPRDAHPHAEREEYIGAGRFTTSWFPRVQLALAALATPIALWVAIDGRFNSVTLPGMSWPAGRMAGALSVLTLLLAGILMPGRSDEETRGRWQYVALGLGMLLLATSGWAWMGAAIPAPWLHRSVIFMASAMLMSLAGGFGLARLLPSASDWIARGRRASPWFGGLAAAMLAVVLVQEGYHRQLDEVGFMTLPAVIAVGLTLAALLAALVGMAVAPRFDPLKLSDRQRTAYVYAAEVVMALIGLHLWLTEPQLFRLQIVAHYWMFLVLAIAFGGAGLAEWFQRRRLPVLSGPLERTAVLLPIGPAAGFWFVGDRADILPLAGASPLVWFLGALFYGALAARRRSLGYGLLAAAAANVGLGVLWQRFDWGLLEHPQLWLIPWGLTILAAEFINHKRIGTSLSTGLRYLGLSLIYIPSSAEFLNHVGNSVCLPLVLVGLSLLGILAGILLRIRSFLFLGLSFLLVVIVTMIKYAAVDLQHTWVFFVACIILGTIVIGSVAFYEKRRTDLATVVRNLKQWQR